MNNNNTQCNNRPSRYNRNKKRNIYPNNNSRYATHDSTHGELNATIEFTPQTLNLVGQSLYMNTPTSPSGHHYHHHQASSTHCCPGSSACDQLNSVPVEGASSLPLIDHNNLQSIYTPPSLCSPMGYEYGSPTAAASSANPYDTTTIAPMMPTQIGYDAYGMATPMLPGGGFPLAQAYASACEYDTYDENGNLVVDDFASRYRLNFNPNDINADDEEYDDEEKEQLACYICRGRRMCFCYFLKVRYYKFPSFLDLIDHQYKKWKSSVQKAKRAAQ